VAHRIGRVHRGLSIALEMQDAEILKLIFGSPDGRFTLVDRFGVAAVRPDRQPPVTRGGDLYLMATVMADCGNGYPWPPPAVIAAWRGCEKYVSACQPAIKEVAAELLVVRKLAYDEMAPIASRAMTGVLRPSMPEWFEAVQQLGLRLEAQAS